MINKIAVQNAVTSAQNFLINARHPDGYWQDFQLAAGMSDEWVTAYIGTALASLNTPKTTAIAFKAWRWLCHRAQSSPGWGYNAIAPRDADSTSWALKLAAAVGCSHWPAAKSAQAFLEQHQHPNGGFATYATDTAIRRFINAPPQLSFQGWCTPQSCVTAAALPQFRGTACNWLQQQQRLDGSWQSYWWCEDEYATALATETLAWSGILPPVQKAVQWALNRINDNGAVPSTTQPTGSAFATAWVVRLLLLSEDKSTIQQPLKQTTEWLLTQQHREGSWSSAAGLRVPPPDIMNPDTYSDWLVGGLVEGGISLDQYRLFTTTTVMQVLSLFLSQNQVHLTQKPYIDEKHE